MDRAIIIGMGFLVTTAYWPYWFNGVMVPRWAIVLVGGPLLLFFVSIRMTVAHAIMLALVAWSAVTLIWTSYSLDGAVALAALCACACAFFSGAEWDNTKDLFVGAALGMIVNLTIVLLQVIDWWPWPQFSSPSGLFSNRNFVSEVAAVVVVGAIAHRILWAIPACLAILLLAWSRASIIAIIAAGIVWVWDRGGRWRIASFLMGIFLVSAAAGSFLVRPSSSAERWTLIRNTASSFSVAGYGIGSFAQNYPVIADHPTAAARPLHAHSDPIEIVHDLGIPGITIVLAMWAMSIVGGRERYVIVALSVEAACGLYPLFLPTLAFMGAFVAGHSSARWCRIRGGSWVFGGISMALSCDGRHPLRNGGKICLPMHREHKKVRGKISDARHF